LSKKQIFNADPKTIEGFGDEWIRFDQASMPIVDVNDVFSRYFSIFPWEKLPDGAEGFDLGCGSGRWAKLVAPRVGRLHCIDPSDAISVAIKNLEKSSNCVFHKCTVDVMPIESGSMDFGYSLGVLHHIPNTAEGLRVAVSKLKPGAPFLLYLYYAFDGRPAWFRFVWHITDLIRMVISRMPYRLRYCFTQLIATFIYWPAARFAKLLEVIGFDVSTLPLSYYRNYSFYVMRTDSLDRFGTRLEQRFTKQQIREMMDFAGLVNINFRENEPFWCAVGFAKGSS